MTQPRKYGVTMPISEMLFAHACGFQQRAHLEPVTPTPDERALHARAVELVREIESNPYVIVSDDDVYVRDLDTSRWVADESDEEYLARFRAWYATRQGGDLS